MILGRILLFLVGGIDGLLPPDQYCIIYDRSAMGLTAGLVDGLALSCVDPDETGMAAGL